MLTDIFVSTNDTDKGFLSLDYVPGITFDVGSKLKN